MRGPILDKLYAERKRCGDLSCTGRPFIEHRNVPVLTTNPRDPRSGRRQIAAMLTEALFDHEQGRAGSLHPWALSVLAVQLRL